MLETGLIRRIPYLEVTDLPVDLRIDQHMHGIVSLVGLAQRNPT